MNIFYILSFWFIVSNISHAKQSNLDNVSVYKIGQENYIYERPHFTDFITKTIPTYKTFFKEAFAKDNWGNLALIAGSSLILFKNDQKIYNNAKKIGRKIGISSDDHTKTFFKIGNLDIYRGPTDKASMMYYIGDGWTHGAIMMTFAGVGLHTGDNRTLQTASQLAHGLLVNTIAIQVLKRMTGHETPLRATKENGRWAFMPSPSKYNHDIPNYDAFPSGHLATAVMTYTVISHNYPEYNYFVRPLSYTLMGLLSFQMVNNGVHWAGDYPLAIGIGYLVGKIAVNSGRKLVDEKNNSSNKVSYYFSPVISEVDGSIGPGITILF